MSQSNLPTLSPEGSLSSYHQEIRKYPMLDANQEFMLAKAWAEHTKTVKLHAHS